ncbi:MAG: ABC transporter permease [Lactobacillales bacterium]|jgi:oligopeptide transport system permease protein|nr:ABC transporter permease [Lactobacillales bacterium]
MENIKNIPKEKFELLGKQSTETREHIAAPSLTFLQDSWRRLKKNKAAVFSMCIILLLVLVSIVTIWVTPYNPTKQTEFVNLPPKLPGVNINGLNGKMLVGGNLVDKYQQLDVPKGTSFLLGTDYLGRDLLSRLFVGMRISLIIGFCAAILDITIGVIYGLTSGLLGGRVDTIMQRILEILSGIPNLVVMILFITVFKPGILTIVGAMALTNWISMARIVRAQTLKFKDQEFVMAATTLGESRWKIALKHILPNISSVIVVQMMFSIPTAIFFEAFLSLIGLGITPPNASLGTLINDGIKNFRFLPYQMWSPALILSIIMIGFNLLADGLRDAFDPKTKE